MTNYKKLNSLLIAFVLGLVLNLQVLAQSNLYSSETTGKKQMTRAQFVAMNEQQQRQLTIDFAEVDITDIVNATKAEAQNPQPGVMYVSLDEYNNSDGFKQSHIVRNPETYHVYDQSTNIKGVENGVVKTKTLTLQELKSLPEDKQKSILESKEFTIIE